MRIARPDIAYLRGNTDQLGTPDEDVTTVIDAADHLTRRERAIAAHASQTSPYDGLPEDLYRDLLITVYARRVRPAWTGGAIETRLFPNG
jgi:LmbE family N-acetylglucosaminyl deacetylase